MKTQGGRWICTDPAEICITQAYSQGNLIHQLPWPNVHIPIAFTYKL